MYIAKNNNLIILAKDTREELEQALKLMVYTSIEETDIDYQLYNGEYLTEEEIEQKERQRLDALNLTKADFWIALLEKDITKEMVKEKINLIPDEKLKAKTLIRLDEADHFWRGDASMNIIGGMFGITPQDLDYLFENKELPTGETLDVDTNP
jgi:hypothetical protein